MICHVHSNAEDELEVTPSETEISTLIFHVHSDAEDELEVTPSEAIHYGAPSPLEEQVRKLDELFDSNSNSWTDDSSSVADDDELMDEIDRLVEAEQLLQQELEGVEMTLSSTLSEDRHAHQALETLPGWGVTHIDDDSIYPMGSSDIVDNKNCSFLSQEIENESCADQENIRPDKTPSIHEDDRNTTELLPVDGLEEFKTKNRRAHETFLDDYQIKDILSDLEACSAYLVSSASQPSVEACETSDTSLQTSTSMKSNATALEYQKAKILEVVEIERATTETLSSCGTQEVEARSQTLSQNERDVQIQSNVLEVNWSRISDATSVLPAESKGRFSSTWRPCIALVAFLSLAAMILSLLLATFPLSSGPSIATTNDYFEDAIGQISSKSSISYGSTFNATIDDNESGGCTIGSGRGNWFTLQESGVPFTISTCQRAAFDTHIAVYNGESTEGISYFDRVDKPWSPQPQSPTAWYIIDGTGKQISASTFDDPNEFGAIFSVYEGSCASLQCVEGSSNSCGSIGGLQKFSWETKVGQTCFVPVHGELPDSKRSFFLSLSTPQDSDANETRLQTTSWVYIVFALLFAFYIFAWKWRRLKEAGRY
jgi:hypothetical protein